MHQEESTREKSSFKTWLYRIGSVLFLMGLIYGRFFASSSSNSTYDCESNGKVIEMLMVSEPGSFADRAENPHEGGVQKVTYEYFVEEKRYERTQQFTAQKDNYFVIGDTFVVNYECDDPQKGIVALSGKPKN